jgi:hypothetical protein
MQVITSEMLAMYSIRACIGGDCPTIDAISHLGKSNFPAPVPLRRTNATLLGRARIACIRRHSPEKAGACIVAFLLRCN